MNTSPLRFGHIGVIKGPKANAEKILDRISHVEAGVYYAENWSPEAKTGKEPLFAYVTQKHLAELNGAQPTFAELLTQYYREFKEGSTMRGYLGEDGAISECRSGKGVARIHDAFTTRY